MQARLLELHFSQLQTEWSTSRYNTYSDERKKKYHDNLERIITSLGNEDFSEMDETAIRERHWIVVFVFKSLEFLNHSTSSTIPFEMVYVLETALGDWLPTKDYIIVTSLISRMNDFSFDGFLAFAEFIYLFIKKLYGITFDHKLLQINLPEIISRDYLASVVLYHELGHFIENFFKIVPHIYIDLLDTFTNSNDIDQKNNIIKYFPYLTDSVQLSSFEAKYHPLNKFAMHIGEYFCDLFASQYVRDSGNFYLEYITRNQADADSTHPSTVNRVIFINEYLDGKNGFVLSEFKRIIKKATSIDVGYKAKDFSTSNFESLIPVEVTDSKQLHGLFVYGWKVWMGEWDNIRQKADIKFKLSSSNVYSIINNLIEKSISNYIVKSEWEIVKA